MSVRASEELFRLLVEGVLDYAIFMLDPQGYIASWNQGAERIKGYRAEEIIGQHFSRFYPPEDVAADKPGRELVIAASEGRYEEEGWRVRKDGSWFWANVLITALWDQDGRVRGFAKVTRDLTERREAQLRLEEHQRLLDTVLETVPVGLLVTDREGRILLNNQAAKRLWGEIGVGFDMRTRYRETSAWWGDTGQPIEPDDWPLWQAIREGQSLLNVAVELEHENGRRFILKSALPLRDPEGRIVGAVIVDQDVTDRHHAEQQLGETRSHLAQAQKMEAVGRLAGGIAHDFNNLLTVINALSLTILKGLGPADPLRPNLEEIHAAGDRAANLTRQLLAFSRRQVLQRENLDLNTVVLNVSRMLTRLLGEQVALRPTLAPDLDPILADRGQLEQVIVNLSLNARDAMPEGGTLTIETANLNVEGNDQGHYLTVPPGRYVSLTVSDTGTGMDQVTRAHIFEPFFTTKKTGEGTGLGLATVYGIIQQSGGGIDVTSAPGEGTSFRIYLPVALERVEQERPEQPPQVIGGSEQILLVEDDPSVRRLTGMLLRSYGYTVLEVGSGEEAIKAARAATRQIDLLLTDVVMPGMSGPELVTRLRDEAGELQVLYMSGYSDWASRYRLSLDSVPFLQKPFDPEVLARKVREALAAGSPAR